MTWDSKVVWTEGMFLRPQHFQQQDRYVERLVRARVAGLRPYPWGITDIAIDRELLDTGKFALRHCRGVLEDGTPFDIQETDELPPPLDLPDRMSNSIVYLVLPVRRRMGADFDAGDGAESGARYGVREMDAPDAVAGSDNRSTLRVGSLRLRYLLDGPERAGHHCLGLARIQERNGGRPRLDERYMPPALNAAALPPLAGFLNEVLGLIARRGAMLANRVSGHAASGVAEIADFLLLQILNRFEPVIANYSRLPDVHPETLHTLLLALAGELSTFTAPAKRPPAFPPYRHDDLAGTFEPLFVDIRRSFEKPLDTKAVPIPLQEHRYGIRTGAVADRTLFAGAAFVLVVKASASEDRLRRELPSLIKIGTVDQIHELVNVNLAGITLNPCPAPRQIPWRDQAAYFELERKNAIWKDLAASGTIAIHLAGDFRDVAMELWAIRD